MFTKPDTFRGLIEHLGGVKAFSDKLGVPENNAKKMRDRNSIAVEHWPRLVMVSKENGILLTTDDFVAMAAHRISEKPRRRVAA